MEPMLLFTSSKIAVLFTKSEYIRQGKLLAAFDPSCSPAESTTVKHYKHCSYSPSNMLQPFTSCFTVLHQKIKFLLNRPRKRSNKSFSSISDLSISSFVHMEMSSQFQQVFKVIDTNGDGKISTTELSEVLSCLGYNKYTAAKEAEGMVRVLDFNGDGFIDMDEFMVVMNGIIKEEDNYGSGTKEHDEYLMDAFLVFDTDKNGLISAKELRRVLLNLGCENCSLRECKRMIKGVDKNGDGFVDFEEFCSMMKTGSVSN